MVKRNNLDQDKLVREDFVIRIKEELTLVDARVLPPPRVIPVFYFVYFL